VVVYLLVGLNEDYNAVFTAIMARAGPISPSELYVQLMSFEQHTSLQVTNTPGSSPMVASRNRGYSGGALLLGLIVAMAAIVHLMASTPTATPSTHTPPTMALLTHGARSV
jgi:hypothetical protein